MSMQPDLFMGSLSSGYSSGVIIDIGHDSTQIICFDQGRPLLHTYKCKRDKVILLCSINNSSIYFVSCAGWCSTCFGFL